jgi:electron transport complex protein RnfG
MSSRNVRPPGSAPRDVLVLGLLGLAAAALLTLVFELTRAPVQRTRQRVAEAELLTVVPGYTRAADPTLDVVEVPARFRTGLGLESDARVHRVRQGERILAVVVPVTSAQGYGGAIRLIVGIDRTGTVTGVKVLEHRETPGLGDRIDPARSDWIARFTGTSLGDPAPERWQVQRDGGAFDQISGATISSRAVVRAVRHALDYFHDDRVRLLDPASSPSQTETP